MRSFTRTIRRLVLVGILLAVIGINALGWLYAYTTTHFAVPGEPSPVEQILTLGGRVNPPPLTLPLPRPENHFTPADGGYPYETHTVPLPNSEWLEGWWVAHPQPRGIALLFHGYGASKQQVLFPAQTLYTLGYSVFLVDFRGSGGSSGNTTTVGIREAEDVAAAAAYVQQVWPGHRLLLYGTSMGSSAVLRAVAVEGVQPAALVLETPFDRLTSAVAVRIRAVGLPTSPAAELLVFWGGMQHQFNGFAHNPVEYAQAVTVPTVLLRGDRDDRVAAAEVEAIFASLRGEKLFISVPGVGHDILLPKTPEIQQQVDAFLWQAGA